MHVSDFAQTQAVGHVRRAAELLALASDRTRDAYGDLPRRARLTGAIEQMQSDTGITSGAERELFVESAKRSGRAFDPRRPIVPWSMMRRDLNMASSGAFLVGEQTSDAAAALRGVSTLARAGVLVLDGLAGDLALPRVATGVTGQWLPDDTSPLTPTQPTVGTVLGTPKTAGALTGMSHLVRLAAPQVEAIVRADLLAGVAHLLDAGALGGSGSNGQPTGLVNVTGIGSVSGAALTWTGALDAQTQCAAAGADDTHLTWISTPAVRKVLAARERASGSGFIWDGDAIANRPAFVSADCASATAFCGDFGLAALLLWGAGFEFALDPTSYFSTGRVLARVLVHCDFVVRHPAAFCKVTSIS